MNRLYLAPKTMTCRDIARLRSGVRRDGGSDWGCVLDR
jgi:hypothetical protein